MSFTRGMTYSITTVMQFVVQVGHNELSHLIIPIPSFILNMVPAHVVVDSMAAVKLQKKFSCNIRCNLLFSQVGYALCQFLKYFIFSAFMTDVKAFISRWRT